MYENRLAFSFHRQAFKIYTILINEQNNLSDRKVYTVSPYISLGIITEKKLKFCRLRPYDGCQDTFRSWFVICSEMLQNTYDYDIWVSSGGCYVDSVIEINDQ